MSRRQFVVSSTLVGAGSLVKPLTFDDSLTVRWLGKKLLISLAECTWEINPELFGKSARLRCEREAQGYVITLSSAFLPGTDLATDFCAQLAKATSGWRINFSIPSLGFFADDLLLDWLRGLFPLTAEVLLRKLDLGGNHVEIVGPQRRLSISPSFRLELGGDGTEVRMFGTAPCTGRTLSLCVGSGSNQESLQTKIDSTTESPVTRFSIGHLRCSDSIPLGLSRPATSVTFEPAGVTECTGEAYDRPGRRCSATLVTGSGTLAIGGIGPNPSAGCRLQLEQAAVLLSSGHSVRLASIAARVGRSHHALDFGPWVATVSGDEAAPLYAEFRDGRAKAVDVSGKLQRLSLPIQDAEVAHVHFTDHPLRIAFSSGFETFGEARSEVRKAKEANENGASIIVVGREPSALVSLNGALINIRRSVDLFNLSFSFEGFDLAVRHGVPILSRRRPKGRKKTKQLAKLTVHFPPQHTAEEWFPVKNPSTCMPDPPPFPITCRARLSGPSRIVFSVPDSQSAKWNDRPLTVGALTDWSSLTLVVNERAMRADESVETQLALCQIDSEKDTVRDALRKVAAKLQPPAESETSLEMTGRLLLSPSCDAKWLTPNRVIDPKEALLWHARLNESGRRDVRAIWSRHMLAGQFAAACEEVSDKGGTEHEKQPLLVLTAEQHRQIVMQSSVYGLIALRRLSDPSKKVGDPVDNAFKTLPSSRVFRPATRYKCLEEMDSVFNFKEKDSGFALPAPFIDANIILTAVGGTLDADWRGEPPHILNAADHLRGKTDPQKYSDLQWPAPLSLERLAYRSQLGRDIRIDYETKGFLIPLGHRATYVELTERRFFKHPNYHYPVAYLVKRTFIVVHRPEKTYPAIYQPFDSRDFPPERVIMLTKTTPDLESPFAESGGQAATHSGAPSVANNGRVRVDGLPETSLVFWPRLTKGAPDAPGAFSFKWATDDNDTPILSNLLFVDNSVLSLEGPLRQIAEYYRSCEPAVRTARSSGSKRRYAATENPGDTSFATDAWLLSVRGRVSPSDPKNTSSNLPETEIFDMDGRMEGADQPPLYPFIERARVKVQSLDRLVGPQGLIDVAFSPTYVRKGFDASENKSEIYLSVLGPDITLDVTNSGNSTGGLAKPNTLVSALSRKIGIVGGKKKQVDPAQPPSLMTSLANRIAGVFEKTPTPTGPLPGSSPLNVPYDFQQAQQGKFDPAEFLAGVANTKLLGLIELKEILKAVDISKAPQLLEKTGYGPAANTEKKALEALQSFAQTAIPALQVSFKEVHGFIEKSFPQKAPFKTFYPALAIKLTTFEQALADALAEIKKATNFAAVAAPVSSLATSGNALLGEIDRTMRDPLPQVVQTDIVALTQAWESLRNGINGKYLEIGRRLQDEIVGKPVTLFCNQVGQYNLAGVLFGVNQNISCEEIVGEPNRAAQYIESSLFSQVFGEPLIDLLIYLRNYSAEVSGRIPWEKRALLPAVLTNIRDALENIPGGNDISSEESIKQLAGKITDQIDQAIATVIATQTTVTDATQVLGVLDSIDRAASGLVSVISSVIQENKDLIKPISEASLQAFGDKAARSVAETADKTVRAKTDQVRQALSTTLQEARAETIQRLLGTAQRIVTTMAKTAIFVQVAKAGKTVKDWCESGVGSSLPKAVEFADDFAGGLLSSTMSSDLLALVKKVQTIEIPVGVPADIREKFERYRSSFLVAAQQLATIIKQLYDQAADLHSLRERVASHNSQACDNLGPLLDLVGKIMQLRRDVVTKLYDLSAQTVAFQALLGQGTQILRGSDTNSSSRFGSFQQRALATTVQSSSSALTEIVRLLGSILKVATSVGQAGVSETWKRIEKDVATLTDSSEVGKLADYHNAISKEIETLPLAAKNLSEILGASALTPSQLQDAAAKVAAYAVDHDKHFASLILQSVALSQNLSQSLGQQLALILSKTGSIFADLHQICSTLLQGVLSLFQDPVVSLILNPEVVSRFTASKNDVDSDLADLITLSKAGNDISLAAPAAQTLNKKWAVPDGRPPALVRAVNLIADVVDNFLRGNVASLINLPDFRKVLESVREKLIQLAAQLLPTRADLSYAWKTGLGNAPADKPVFQLRDGQSNEDLTIASQVSVDFITGARSSKISGVLKPFNIILLPTFSLDLAIIKFKGAHFDSQDGSAPGFRADIDDVVIGKDLKFLEPLQAWMSPGGTGVYVKPIVLGGAPGVEAGYIYDAGLIQLGSVQFINVAIGIGARLPFGNHAAELDFRFASPERPFMISQPPYGGGGYVRLLANAQGITDFALSFVFGAVVTIKFGPLNAHGRVVAGILITNNILRAFVEAVGEGNIACFSICVSIQVALEFTPSTNEFTGSTTYSMSFKVGFITLSYGFTAHYTIPGSGGGGGGKALNSALRPEFFREDGTRQVAKELFEDRVDRWETSPATDSVRLQEVSLHSSFVPDLKSSSMPPSEDCSSFDPCVKPNTKSPHRIFNRTPRRESEWSKYRRRIAIELLRN